MDILSENDASENETQATTIVFMAQGSNGRQAQVQATGTGGGDQELRLDISGMLDTGEVVKVDVNGGGGGADGVFDVEAKTIDVDDDVIDV